MRRLTVTFRDVNKHKGINKSYVEVVNHLLEHYTSNVKLAKADEKMLFQTRLMKAIRLCRNVMGSRTTMSWRM